MTKKANTSSKDTVNLVVLTSELEDGKVSISGDISLEWLSGQLEACEYTCTPNEAKIDATLDKYSGGVMLKGKIQIALGTICCRCLEPTDLVVKSKLSTFLLPRSECHEHLSEEELTPEELEREWYDGEKIALNDLVRDAIMLELPMNPRCQDGCAQLDDDDEVAPKTKSSNQIDPRLAPLAGIKLNKES